MLRIIIVFLAISVVVPNLPAQSSTDANVAAYYYKKSKKYINKYDYYRALPYLKQSVNLAPNNALYSFTLGKAMFEVGDVYNALPHFQRAYKFNPSVSPDVNWYLARTLHLNQKYSDAQRAYEREAARYNNTSREYKNTMLAIEQCKAGMKIGSVRGSFDIRNLGEFVNSRFHEYGATFGQDDSYMLFTSRRPRNLNSLEFGLYNREDINEEVYHARKSDEDWMQTRAFSKPIPIFSHDAPVALADDGNTLVYYADKNYGDIFVSHKEGDKWSKRESIGAQINTELYHEPSIYITPGGSSLYFVSDRPGGQGDLDIYISNRTGGTGTSLKGAIWGDGTNLGAKINTPAKEDAPFLSADGKHFYFSSEGHNSIGGFDIFRCDRLPDGSWSDPVNLGVPINSPGDDIYYVEKPDGNGFYFSSDRPGGHGGMDLYSGEASMPIPGTLPAFVAGNVLDDKAGKPVKAEVRLVDATTSEVLATKVTDPATGAYNLEVPPGHQFRVDVKVAGSTAQPTASQPGEMNILTGSVVDGITHLPMAASIDVIDPTSNTVVKSLTSNPANGSYLTDLESGHNYQLRVKSENYMPYFEEFRVNASGGIEAHQMEIPLQRVNNYEKLVLTWQFFDPTSSELKTESITDLNNVAKIMKEVPDLKLDIIGHTDSDSDPEYNMALSIARANSVADYLIKKGVAKDRLMPSGRGETVPIYSNDTQETKKWNRRVELFIHK